MLIKHMETQNSVNAVWFQADCCPNMCQKHDQHHPNTKTRSAAQAYTLETRTLHDYQVLCVCVGLARSRAQGCSAHGIIKQAM